jgi:4-amino-4-deoxy-L-arabinose transferase-like glycosyltransferase
MSIKVHYLLIFIFALSLRLGVLYELRNVNPIAIGSDQRFYYTEALAWPVSWPRPVPYFAHPLMTVLYLFAFKLFGVSPLAPRILNCILGAFAVPITAAAGVRLFDRRTGLVAGWLLAVYQGGVFFSTTLLDVSMTTLALAVALWAVSRPDRRSAIVAGLILSLAVLGRGVLLATVAGLVGWWLLRRQWAAAMTFGTVVAVILLPIVARNAYYGQITLVGKGAAEFWMGNNPLADGTYSISEGDAAYRVMMEISKTGGDYLGHVARYIEERPLDWAALTAKKAAAFIFLPDWVLDNNVSLFFEGWRYSWLLRFLPGWGLLTVLAAGGLIMLRRRWRELLPLAAVYAPYALGTIAIFVLARFRAPLAVTLAIPAAMLVQDVAARVKMRFKSSKP